jgi:hypothetical protein
VVPGFVAVVADPHAADGNRHGQFAAARLLLQGFQRALGRSTDSSISLMVPFMPSSRRRTATLAAISQGAFINHGGDRCISFDGKKSPVETALTRGYPASRFKTRATCIACQ